MKKLLKIMTAAAVLLCGLALTGCGLKEIVKQTVDDSYNQWFKYKTEKKIDIPLLPAATDDLDSTEESTQKLENAEIYLYFNPAAGLTVSIQSQTVQTVELLSGLYSQDLTITVGANKEYTLQEFGKTKWYALWGSGKIEESDEPEIHAHPEKCVVIGEGKAQNAKVQWKKFLANYLLDSLLED